MPDPTLPQSTAQARPAAATPAAAGPALRASAVAKTYGAVKALQPTSLELAPGEVHALVGENGSGKSTFVGIVSGTVTPDAGTVEIGGRACRSHTPWEAIRRGALTVFQDGSVIAELSIAQNLYLGTPAAGRPAYREVNAWARRQLEEFGLGRMSPKLPAGRLSAADRQLLEIARAMMARPTVLLLDEATSALDAAGVDVALGLMRKAAAAGSAVLFVTHRLSEVFRVADRISVLRDGQYRGTHDPASIDQDGLVELMAGRSVKVEFPPVAAQIGEAILEAKGLEGEGYGPLDLRLRRGEILGIAGADGNGQLQLLGDLAAIADPKGDLVVEGRPVRTFGQAWDAGVAYLSSDRRDESLFQTLPIRENLVAGVLGKLSQGGVVTKAREDRQVEESIDRYGIKLGSPEEPMTSLSGGNQQKVALGKVLETGPRVLLCDEPTQGVDVRSRLEIYRMLRDGAEAGLAVVIVSSDAAELAGLCDRVIVLSRGQIVAEMQAEGSSEESIVHAFTGHESGAGDDALEQPTGSAPGSSVPAAVRSPWARLRDFVGRHEDLARLSLLALILVLLGAYTQNRESTFLTPAGIYNVLLLALPLAAVAAAQFVVMFIGGIDLSVAGTMGVTVCLLSFWVQSGSTAVALILALLIGIGVGTLIGIGNSTLIERLQISPVIATIATLGILQGIGLTLRPTAAGSIDLGLTELLTKKVWVFPLPLIVLAVLFVLADWLMRSTGTGLRLRAVGLNSQFAYRLGVNAPRLRQLSYVICAALAGVAGVILAGQVGVGDSTVGNQYLLLAVAAPILGGAGLLGGRGTFIGCGLGAVLLALGLTLPTTLNLGEGWNYILTGGLTLIALTIYTQGVATTISLRARSFARRLSSLRPRAA
jgi:ribose transport system ATP-binding protein